MSTVIVNALAGTLPQGFCPTGATALQTLYNEFINRTQFSLASGVTFYNSSQSAPSPDNRVYPWLKLDGNNRIDRWYTWDSAWGVWLSPHPTPPSSDERRMWVGIDTDLITYDGGDANPLSLYSGAMWQIDTAFEAKFPVGVGTFAASGAVAVTGTGGEDKHLLTTSEIPAHAHTKSSVTITDVQRYGNAVITLEAVSSTPSTDPGMSATTFTTDQTGGGTSHNNLPPYIGVYVIKRSIRQFYVG